MYRPFILLRPERSHIGDVARSCWLTLLLAIGSWAFVGVPAPAQVFEYIGMEQGLSSRRVLSIEQDAQGYMWILTHKGVDRYDGTRFTHYKLRSEGKDMYFYPDLNTLYADSGQALWEFGKDGKIFRFDYRKDAFELVFDLHQAVPDTRNYPITSVYLDPSLRVWFHCYQQTVVFDTRQRTCRTVTTDPTMAPVDAMVTDGGNGYFLAAGPTLYHAAYADGELKTLSSITLDRIRLINYLYYHPHTRKLVVNTLLDGLYIIDTNHWEVLRPAIRLKDIGINIVKPFFDSTTEVLVATDGDGVYKLDYSKVLEYHIEKKADITVVCKDMEEGTDVTRFGCVKLNEDGRIMDFEEKPMASDATTISCGIYVIRRRQLIELLERCAAEDRYDLVNDILVRYKNLKRIYAYKLRGYWSNIASVDSYYKTNMDFLNKEVRDYFFKEYPDVYTKLDDLPPAKYNPGAVVRNSLISSGCILNGVVENSILFKKAYVGNNCVIRNSIILNDVYIGDNTVIENCIVESRDTIRANTTHIGSPENIKIVIEKNERYTL